jgi:NAD(P)-dependent dehydrogenase (short-subunit alcohol dehydrogenase family)
MTFNKLDNLEGKVAVITGGAGQIGYATAIRLAEQKCRVIIITRKETQELYEKINFLPNKELKHFFIIADITDEKSLKNAVEQVTIQAKRCDILINSVSSGYNKIKADNIEELTDQIFNEIIKINLTSVYATIRTFLPLLNQTDDNLIVNISSASSLQASGQNLAYSASKAGINILTKILGKILSPKIRVICIVPSFLEKGNNNYDRNIDVNKKIIESTPLKRLITGDDIANTIISYATHIRFTTGNIIIIDGGRSA